MTPPTVPKLLVTALALGILVAPLAADAQQPGKVYRIGILRPAPDNPVFRRDFEGFRQILRENDVGKCRANLHAEHANAGDPLCRLRVGGERRHEDAERERGNEQLRYRGGRHRASARRRTACQMSLTPSCCAQSPMYRVSISGPDTLSIPAMSRK